VVLNVEEVRNSVKLGISIDRYNYEIYEGVWEKNNLKWGQKIGKKK